MVRPSSQAWNRPSAARQRSSWAACSANLKRIGANVDPDGAAFPRANPAAICADACARARAARCSRACANWPNGASMPPRWRRNQPVTNTADRVGSVSQFGQTVTVGRAQWPKDRATYAERRLLGFGREDEDLALQVAGDAGPRLIRRRIP
jgi:hypothetical protein